MANNRFLERQLKHAEDKPLGRQECHYGWNEKTNRPDYGVHRVNSAKKPPNTPAFQYPVGRKSGVVKPGAEADGERYAPQPIPGVAAVK